MKEEKKNKFIVPLVEIVFFTNDDIITLSGDSAADIGNETDVEDFK